MAANKVDFPFPLGPIKAWISPLETLKSRPFRISLPAISTCKFLMVNVLMVGNSPSFYRVFTEA
jgi:hypothetical protein